VYVRRHKDTKQCCKPLDLFFSKTHFVEDGEVVRRHDKAIGGISTVVVFVLMVTLVAVVAVNSVYDPVYTRAMSPVLPQFFPTGAITVSTYYYGMAADACTVATVSVVATSAFGTGVSVSTYDTVSRTCTSVWTCVAKHCTLGVDSVQFVFESNTAVAYAAAVSWSIEFPAYSSSAEVAGNVNDRFYLAGEIVPAPNAVLRGGLAQLTVSHIPTVLQNPRGAPLIGSFAQLATLENVVDANQTEFATTETVVGVVIIIVPSIQIYSVSAPPADWVRIVATCAAYLSALLGSVRVCMNVAERLFPKNHPNGFRRAWSSFVLCFTPCLQRPKRRWKCCSVTDFSCSCCSTQWCWSPPRKTVDLDIATQASPTSSTEMLARADPEMPARAEPCLNV
jgi:hypothetical protein